MSKQLMESRVFNALSVEDVSRRTHTHEREHALEREISLLLFVFWLSQTNLCVVFRTHAGLDFKVITSVSSEKFGDWEKEKFKPEEDFLEKLKAIDGISTVETQTFTIMPM